VRQALVGGALEGRRVSKRKRMQNDRPRILRPVSKKMERATQLHWDELRNGTVVETGKRCFDCFTGSLQPPDVLFNLCSSFQPYKYDMALSGLKYAASFSSSLARRSPTDVMFS
jgi:hypothetical protein